MIVSEGLSVFKGFKVAGSRGRNFISGTLSELLHKT